MSHSQQSTPARKGSLRARLRAPFRKRKGSAKAASAPAPAEYYGKPPRPWPVVLLALPAYVAIWGGWVELGQMSGFGPVNLLPGIGDGLTLNLAITRPFGMEVYAAYAMSTWLSKKPVSPEARTFAMWSSIAALVLGSLGQVAYHLLVANGITVAPWWVVVVVACLPVAVVGMGAALAHLRTGHGAVGPVATPDQAAPASAADAGPVLVADTAVDGVQDQAATDLGTVPAEQTAPIATPATETSPVPPTAPVPQPPASAEQTVPAQAEAASPAARSEQLHLVQRPAAPVRRSAPREGTLSDEEAIAVIDRLDAEASDGVASRRTIETELICGATRASRLAALARAHRDERTAADRELVHSA